MTRKPPLAKVYLEAVGLTCPHCQEAIVNPATGSHLIDPDAYEALLEEGTVECEGCEKLVSLPPNPFVKPARHARPTTQPAGRSR